MPNLWDALYQKWLKSLMKKTWENLLGTSEVTEVEVTVSRFKFTIYKWKPKLLSQTLFWLNSREFIYELPCCGLNYHCSPTMDLTHNQHFFGKYFTNNCIYTLHIILLHKNYLVLILTTGTNRSRYGWKCTYNQLLGSKSACFKQSATGIVIYCPI